MIYVDEKEPVGGEALASNDLLVDGSARSILSLVIFFSWFSQ